MFLGVLNVELHIPESGSLKSKRKVLKCLKDKIRSNFNVSVSETDHQEKWQRALIGVACIGCDKKYINGTLSRISNLISGYHLAEIVNTEMEIW